MGARISAGARAPGLVDATGEGREGVTEEGAGLVHARKLTWAETGHPARPFSPEPGPGTDLTVG